MKRIPSFSVSALWPPCWLLTFCLLDCFFFPGLLLHSGCSFLFGEKYTKLKLRKERENHLVAHEEPIILKYPLWNGCLFCELAGIKRRGFLLVVIDIVSYSAHKAPGEEYAL